MRGIVPQNRLLAIVLILILTAASPQVSFAVVKLTPQNVADLVLSKGSAAHKTKLEAQRSYLPLQKALGAYDLQFKFASFYEVSDAENITMTSNPRDRTQTILGSLSKRLSTGTNLALEFNSIQLASTLAPSNTRSPNVSLNAAQLAVRQALWGNSFGYADRLAESIGRGTIEAALEARDNNLQTILLDAMVLYWKTFVAERQLKENIAAREKYEVLIKNVRRKAGFNLSTPGELPRLQAELEGVEQRVKSSSAEYLNSLQALISTLRLETKEPVEIAAPLDLPSVPKLAEKDIKTLRPVRIARTNLENARNQLAEVKSRNHPKLDLVAKAKVTGVDEANGASLAEMQAGSKPYYYVGLEFETPFWGSDLKRGLIADAEVGIQQAEVELGIQAIQARDLMTIREREVASFYAIAKSAKSTVDFRSRVVRDLEVAYRQGRQSLVELIRAYNELFSAQQAEANAIGNYHIALNRLAAARDELIVAPKEKR